MTFKWMQFRLRTLLIGVALVGVSIAIYRWLHPPPEFPASWKLEEISEAVTYGNETLVDCDVLAWHIADDDRPGLPIEECLVWAHLRTSSGADRFRVVHAWHYSRKGPYHWQMPRIHVSYGPEGPGEDDVGPITSTDIPQWNANDEIMAFIHKSTWDWVSPQKTGNSRDSAIIKWLPLDRFRYIDGKVCQRAWRRRVGTPFKGDVPKDYLEGPFKTQ